MAPQNAARVQQPGALPLPPGLVLQTNIFRAEHMELVKENKEVKEQLEAARRENEQLKKDSRRAKNARKGDDGGQQSGVECLKLQKEKQALGAVQTKLRADLKRTKKRLDAEQSWSKQLATQNSRLEVNLQVEKGKIQALTRQLRNRENQLKVKDSEIQILNSKLKNMANARKEYYNRSPHTEKSRRGMKRGLRDLEIEMEKEVSSWMGLDSKNERNVPDTGHQPPLSRPTQYANNADPLTQINQGSDIRCQEKGEQQKPTTGYGPQDADWVFWSTADEYSGSEVVSQVERLNSEMLQVAANMVDGLDLENQARRGGQELTDATTRAARIIGPRLTGMLATSNSQYVDIIVQTALQTALLTLIEPIISSWSLLDGNEDLALRSIHKRLQETRPQPVSGRWRQLTKSCIERMDEHVLVQLLTESLANIVVATGCSLDQATVRERFMRFSPRLGEIIKLAFEVRTMIGEGITSCDFEIMIVPHDSPYDPKNMETVYSENSSSIQGKESVICTVDLGLMRVEKASKPEVHTKELVVLKPKVLLPVVFDTI